MPQLDFVWWAINFLLIWAAIIVVLSIILNSKESSDISQTSSTEIKKNSTTWQWF